MPPFVLPTLVPLLAIALGAHALWRLGFEWRRSILLAIVGGGVLSALLCEFLSMVDSLYGPAIFAVWSSATLILLGFCTRLPNRAPIARLPFERGEKCMAAALALLIAAVLLQALISTPNGADGLSYHLPRVRQWLQQASLAHYPTTISRQLYLGPGAEYQLLQIWALTGSPHFLALAESFAWMASLLAVSILSSQLGASRRLQWATTLFFASLPMGILQASSVQNNCILSMWLAIAWMAMMELHLQRGKPGRHEWTWLLVAAAAVGLGCATKATFFILGTPYVLWSTVLLWRKWGNKFWQPALLFVATCTLLAAPGFLRNAAVFPSALGPESAAYRNQPIGVKALLSNLVRNTANEMGAPLPLYNYALTTAGYLCKRVGIAIEEPGYTWQQESFFVSPAQTDEGFAGAPIHVLALALASILLLRRPKNAQKRNALLQQMALAMTAFLLFCAYLRWQPFGNRLLLPLFGLALPAASISLAKGRQKLLAVFVSGAFVLALPATFLNQMHPLLGKNNIFRSSSQDDLFRAQPPRQQEIKDLFDHLTAEDVHRLGLIAAHEAQVELLWSMRDQAHLDLQIDYVPSTLQPLYGPEHSPNWVPPDWIVVDGIASPQSLQVEKKRYHRILQMPSLSLFMVYEDPKN